MYIHVQEVSDQDSHEKHMYICRSRVLEEFRKKPRHITYIQEQEIYMHIDHVNDEGQCQVIGES